MHRPNERIVILGAGPTGLGAAERLQELGYSNWLLCERDSVPGGLARSFTDELGFTWDIGGHVVFSHYPEFTAMLDRVGSGFGWLRHEREAWIQCGGNWVPYPFQRNLHRLAPHLRETCLEGLRRRAGNPAATPPAHLDDFLAQSFGEGLCDVFMRPYNRKVWTVALERMDWHWVGDRVAEVDVAQLERQIARGEDDVSWGPNSTFRFPLRGGTGAIWEALARTLEPSRCRYGCAAEAVDLARHQVRLSDGTTESYDWLISTVPITQLCAMAAAPDLSEHAAALGHSTATVVGLGLRGAAPPELATKCWMYFPEPEVPFYRVTHFSHYSPHNAPDPGCWSLLCEIATPPGEAPDREAAVGAVIAGAIAAGILSDAGDIMTTWHTVAPYSYPQPLIGRDAILRWLQPLLEEQRVLSRGRFGSWLYEVGNMDHCYMQGREAVNRLLAGERETTVTDPARVNARRAPS